MSFVQDISGSTATASATTIVQAITGVTSGNLLRAVVGYKFSSSRTVSVSDGVNSYTASGLNFYDGSSNWGLAELYLPSAPSGTSTLTATFSAGTTDQFIYIQERSNCTGVDVAGTVLNSVPGSSGANVILSNAITTTATDDLCGFCVLVNGTAPAITTGTTLAWVGRTTNPWTPQGSNGLMASEDLSAQAASSYTATFGMASAGGRYLTYIIGYANPGGGAAVPAPMYHRKNVLYFI